MFNCSNQPKSLQIALDLAESNLGRGVRMDTRLIVLELVLKELDIGLNIDTLEDRIRLQKAVYITQEAGVPLGHRFSWYVRGPYSPGLARDYYYLQLASEDELDPNHGRSLRQQVKETLEGLRPIMSASNEVPLEQPDWLELVSSIHYLHKTVGTSNPEEARTKLHQLKPRLSPYIPQAERALWQIGLLDSDRLQ